MRPFFAAPIVAIEWGLVGLLVLGVVLLHRISLFGAFARFRKFAANRRAALLLSFLLPLATRTALLPLCPIPDPSIHDEFSHLLLADTLVHGRLANPPHPMWRYFESIHVLQQPNYASMYPPAQGAFLAFGELFGIPWLGVLLCNALMCAAICWMLQGWFPPHWALFGTLLVIAKLCLTGIWIDSYLGGAPAALGAALVLGAAVRLRHPMIMAAGFVLLMNSRPFEGAVLGTMVLWYVYRRGAFTQRFAVGLAMVMVPALAFAGYYNFRVTGHALKMPYVLNRESYGWPENLGFLPEKKLAPLNNAQMEAMRLKELDHRRIYHDAALFVDNFSVKAFDNWTVLLGPLLTIPLLFVRCRQRTRAVLFLLAALLLLTVTQMVLYPYHLGPTVPLLFAAVLLGIRTLYVRLKRWSPGHARVALVGLLCGVVAIDGLKEYAPELHIPLAYWENGHEPEGDPRARIARLLANTDGQHLVVVRYFPGHDPSQEWVYNSARIDASKVVWARGLADDAPLLKYFRSRRKWIVFADTTPPRLLPYF